LRESLGLSRIGCNAIVLVLVIAGFGGSASIARGVTIGPGPVAGAPGLPDDRAYEQISPIAKNGYNVRVGELGESFTVSAESGDAVDYQALGAFEGSSSNPLTNLYMAARGPSSWSTSALDPALPEPSSTLTPGAARVEYVSAAHLEQPVFSSDEPLTLNTPATFFNEFLRKPDGSYALLTTTEAGAFPSSTVVLGASADLSHIIFGQPVYDWAHGELRLAATLPDGTTASNSYVREIGNPISSDGSRIFFVDSFPAGQLYDRIKGNTTIRVSAPQRNEPDPLGMKPVHFEVATADGSNVLFISCEKLTADSTAVGTQSNCHRIREETEPFEGTDLYQWHEDPVTHARELTDLTVDVNSDPAGASVQGVVGVSNDGSYVYFVAEGRLAAGAVLGHKNLYVWHEGEVRFIVPLSASDSAVWGVLEGGIVSEGLLAARVTADGKHLAFMSAAKLAGYNNTDVATGSLDSEVYEYSADNQELRCASCDPSGARPIGGATLITHAEHRGYLTRNLNADGSRLVFSSPDPLVRGSANGHMKVFEYENGAVDMISSGTSRADDYFGDASATGNDVFIVTQSPLAAEDGDSLYDLYDARSGGHATPPADAASTCRGESCQGSPSAPPTLSYPASASVIGPGNLTSSLSPPKRPASSGKLSRILHACRAKRNRRKRATCEASARRRYGAKAKKTSRRGQ
jgi:hypothetical protein